MREVVIPAVGFAMTEALLVGWTREPGDAVAEGDAIAEIETDKTTADLEAPVAGILGRHRFAAGAIVPVGVALAVILDPGEVEMDAPGPTLDGSAVEGATTPASAGGADSLVAVTRTPSEPAELAEPTEPAEHEAADVTGGRRPHRQSPRQRAGLGASTRHPTAAPAMSVADVGRFRALIADKVSESWRTIPHFAVTREIPAEAILEIRAARTARGATVPTVTDLLVRALAIALAEAGAPDRVDVGLAVATPAGVMIPVLRDVLAMTLDELSVARAAAVERARAGHLSPADLADPPRSTLSNLGALGVDQFSGVIAVGQSSLLTVGRISRRVVAVGDAIAIRPMFTATLNADHRAIDGADAAAILGRFADAATTTASLDLESAR